MQKPVMTSARVTLRPARESDKRDRQAAGHDPAYQDLMREQPLGTGSLTQAHIDRWYAEYDQARYGWMLEYQGRCIGALRLTPANAVDAHAMLGLGIFDPAARGQGLGTEALHLIARYAFVDNQIHRLGLTVLEDNLPALTCYERFGFQREGVQRQAALVAGQWRDLVMMGLLRPDYLATYEAT